MYHDQVLTPLKTLYDNTIKPLIKDGWDFDKITGNFSDFVGLSMWNRLCKQQTFSPDEWEDIMSKEGVNGIIRDALIAFKIYESINY